MTEKEYKKRKKGINNIFIGVAIVAVVLWALSGFAIHYISSENNEIRGTFGDMFGAINALFSGLALGGVIYTILLQRLELELQRDEIRYSSEQLKGQKEILDRQNFEDKFFKLLSQYENLVSQAGSGKLHGKNFLANELKKINDKITPQGTLEDVIKYFNETVTFHSIQYVFDFIIRIVKFIDNSKNLSASDKEEYINLFKFYLSNQELVLVLIYIYSLKSHEELLKLCENYKFFSQIQFEIGMDNHDQLIPYPELLFNINLPHLKKQYDEQLKLFPK